MMSISIARKHCARCNGGIYTTWRAIDDRNFFHPQCFTCVTTDESIALCGIILDSVKENGAATAVSTRDEIYCKRCHNEKFGVRKTVVPYTTDTEQRSSTTTNANANDFFSNNNERSPSGYIVKAISKEGSNVNILFSATSPFSAVRNEEHVIMQQKHNTSGATRNKKKKVKVDDYGNSEVMLLKTEVVQKKKCKKHGLTDTLLRAPVTPVSSASVSVSGTDMDIPERKSSRIPRPTSAQSKKSLMGTQTLTKSKSTKLSNSEMREKNIKNPKNRPPPVPARNYSSTSSKMHRSASLVQARNTEGINGEIGKCSSTNTKPKKLGSHSRPRSALTAALDEKSVQTISNLYQMQDNQSVQPSVSKRQCAASFTTKTKKGSKTSVKTTKSSKNNEEYIINPYTNIISFSQPQLKGGIPSAQAILTAIRREGSELFKLNPSCQSRLRLLNSESHDFTCHNDSSTSTFPRGFSAALPRRSFNMTFECPICISSLVPSGSTNTNSTEKSCSDGLLCRNVVTPCGHLFHGKCMDNWLKIQGNKRCPICSALCLPETLQPVYLECNLCADLNPKTASTPAESTSNVAMGRGNDEIANATFRSLRAEYDLLKAKYNAILADNRNNSLNVSLAVSLQSAYEVECRNRLQLQCLNRKLLTTIEELKNSKQND